jgi:hypothetical protein
LALRIEASAESRSALLGAPAVVLPLLVVLPLD